MPYLPVPSLKETCDRLVDSVKPVMSDAEHQAFTKKAHEFFYKYILIFIAYSIYDSIRVHYV